MSIPLDSIRALIDAGRSAEALAELDLLLAARPQDGYLHFQRGRALMGLSRWADAVASLSDALAREGAPPEAHYNLGLCRGRLGQHAEAVEAFSRFLAEKPEDVDGLVQRANRRLDAGAFAEACGDYEAAISRDPAMEKDLRSWADLARTLDRPGSPSEFAAACLERGWAKLQNGDPGTATTWFTRAIGASPGGVEAFRGRAEARAAAGLTQDALADAAKAVELEPASPEVWYTLGVVRRDTGDVPAALEAFGRAIERRRDYAQAWFGRGVARGDADDFAGAEADYTAYLELKPDGRLGWLNRGWARRKQGRNAEAVADLTRCLELDPSDAQAWMNRAYARQALGETEAMRQDFRKAVELNPAFEAEVRPHLQAVEPPRPAPISASAPAPAPAMPRLRESAMDRDMIVMLAVTSAVLVALGLLRIPYLSGIPSRIVDIPVKTAGILLGVAEGLEWNGDVCNEPFCMRTDTEPKHVWGRKGYTSQVRWSYCPEHEPSMLSTGSRLDGLITMPYWLLVYVGLTVLGVLMVPPAIRLLMWPVLLPLVLVGRRPRRILFPWIPNAPEGSLEARLDDAGTFAAVAFLVLAGVAYWWF